MDDSKTEENHALCRGCLSSDRTLLPLKQNFDLYTLLLNDGMIYKDLKYFNTYFCWECAALLRRTKEFQRRIQKAQHYFNQLLSENELFFPQECLSSLKTFNNNVVEYLIYTETKDLKTNTSLKCDQLQTHHNECTIKEESFYDSDKDIDTSSLNEVYFCEIAYEKKKTTKTREVKKEVESNQSNGDKNKKKNSRMSKVKFNSHVDGDNDQVTKCTFTFKDVDAMKKLKTSTWKIAGFNTKANLYMKHLKSLRKKDELQSCKIADTNITCSSCKSSVLTTEISQHWDAHIITLYKCIHCQYYGKNIRDFAYHLKQHTVMYKCKECWLQYSTRSELYAHYRNMHERAQCDYCGIKFRYKKSIERHIRVRHTPSRCDQCGRICSTKQLLRRHIQDVHPSGKKELCYCVECDVHFKTHAQYKVHLKTTRVHRIKPAEKIPCPECNKIYSKRVRMNNHYKYVHLKKTNHYCEKCSRYFLDSCSLRLHVASVHDKIPPVKNKVCPHCGRAFSTNRMLENHIRTHTGERPFACTLCTSKFTQRVALTSHLRSIHKY